MKVKSYTNLALSLLLLGAASQVSGDIVYDNSSARASITRFATSGPEFGEEIVLAGSGPWTITNFQYEYFGYGPDFVNGNARVRLRFYRNDGPNGVPNTLFYDSGVSAVPATAAAGNVLEYEPNVPAPQRFTWTVEFSGLSFLSTGGLQSAGLDLYQTPTIGQTFDDYWERSGSTWTLRAPAAGSPPINFGCRVQATVQGRPVITQQPQGANVCPGQTVVLSVSAVGNAPLSYQWQKNGVSIPGATGSTLTLANVAAGDAGNYTVIVTNPNGSVTSAVAVVTVGALVPMPGVVVYDNSTTRASIPRFASSGFEMGDEIILAGTGTFVIDNFKFEYFGRGADFDAGRVKVALRFYRNDGPNGVPSTKIYDSGFDTVGATGPDGNVLEYAGLSVSVPRNFTWTVEFMGLTSSSAGGLQAGGLDLYGPPTVGNSFDDFWERSGSGGAWVLRAPLPGEPKINFGARATATLTGAPVITSQPRSIVVCRGDSVTLSVTAVGSSALTYQWLHNGVPVPGATSSTLVIPAVDNSDTGNYTVIVNSCVGSTTSQTAKVEVSNPNQTSPCLRIVRGAPGQAIISWTTFYGAGWVLQSTPSLNPPIVWTDVPITPVIVDGRYTVVVPTEPKRCYRLVKR